ncbi:AraC family transcriptional regulator [Aquimarina sp. AU474]|uniref:AraC family transcriptional regulator n=1 Tax=Aquimarina sp. AU474 TaxID=2108529 RepID=UPI000D6911AC|nr:AraC family transcriptional regulator [Aquimarina sp. AU474]
MPFTITTRYTIILIFISTLGYGQSFVLPDSLKGKTNKELGISYHAIKDKDKSKAEIYLRTILANAKKSNDSVVIVGAFSRLSWLFDTWDIRKIRALDSTIIYSKNIEGTYWPEVFYNRRALHHNNQGNLKKALNDYLVALEHTKKKNNITYIYILKHNIALLKRKLGKYEEAKKLLNECLVHERLNMITKKGKWDSIGYLNSLTELVSTYRLNKQIDSAKILNKEGIQLSKGKNLHFLFNLNDGILDYHDQKYLVAKKKILKILPKLYNDKEVYAETFNLIEAHLYLGKSNQDLGLINEAISNFKKTDSISRSSNYFIPESRLPYVELINYYKSLNDGHNQLIYINKLLSVDSVLFRNFNSINDRLIKEYDTPILLEEKEKLITSLEKENNKRSTQNIIMLILLGLSIVGIGYYYYRQKRYKERFLKLLHETEDRSQKNEILSANTLSNSGGINKEAFDNLIDQLEQFEKNKGYLKPKLNSKDLAKSFGSNSSYLSKVINTFKEKSFSNYINDLRIDFVIDRLRTDAIFRKYTIKAIAQDIGFNNAEAFSKAFYKKTGIYPSYFIKELDKTCL